MVNCLNVIPRYCMHASRGVGKRLGCGLVSKDECGPASKDGGGEGNSVCSPPAGLQRGNGGIVERGRLLWRPALPASSKGRFA